MKKYLIVFVLFASLNVYGQFNTGSVYFGGLLGGNLGVQFQEGTTSIPYYLYLEGGYFIQNRLSVGGNIHTHGEFILSGFNPGTHELYVGPAVRYYLARTEGLQIYFYGNPFFSLTTDYNKWGLAGGAGINYFITDRISLEARGVYKVYSNTLEDYAYNTHYIGVEAGFSIFFPSIGFFDGIFRQSDAEEKTPRKKDEDWSPN